MSARNALQLLLLIVSITISTASYAKVIMIFGDSLSASYGMKVEDGWVRLLEQRLSEKSTGYKIANASISGNTSGNGLGRIKTDIDRGLQERVRDDEIGPQSPRGSRNCGDTVSTSCTEIARIRPNGVRYPGECALRRAGAG